VMRDYGDTGQADDERCDRRGAGPPAASAMSLDRTRVKARSGPPNHRPPGGPPSRSGEFGDSRLYEAITETPMARKEPPQARAPQGRITNRTRQGGRFYFYPLPTTTISSREAKRKRSAAASPPPKKCWRGF